MAKEQAPAMGILDPDAMAETWKAEKKGDKIEGWIDRIENHDTSSGENSELLILMDDKGDNPRGVWLSAHLKRFKKHFLQGGKIRITFKGEEKMPKGMMKVYDVLRLELAEKF